VRELAMPHGFKAGGRRKGTPNKKTQNLMELISEHHKNFDPVLELIDIFKNEKTPVDLKVNILKDITQYIYPKRKSIEADIKADTDIHSEYNINMPIDELISKLHRNKN
jgi:hypothetical protein